MEGIATTTQKAPHYFAAHSKLETQVDIAVVLAKKWESLSGEYETMSGNPLKPAKWLDEKTGTGLGRWVCVRI